MLSPSSPSDDPGPKPEIPPRAHRQVREGNLSLEGLMGFDLNERTVGTIGTGKIGHVVAQILPGFGCEVVAHDLAAQRRDPAL